MDGDKDAGGATRSVKVKDSTGAEYTDAEEFTGHQLEAATYDGAKLISKVIGDAVEALHGHADQELGHHPRGDRAFRDRPRL